MEYCHWCLSFIRELIRGYKTIRSRPGLLLILVSVWVTLSVVGIIILMYLANKKSGTLQHRSKNIIQAHHTVRLFFCVAKTHSPFSHAALRRWLLLRLWSTITTTLTYSATGNWPTTISTELLLLLLIRYKLTTNETRSWNGDYLNYARLRMDISNYWVLLRIAANYYWGTTTTYP